MLNLKDKKNVKTISLIIAAFFVLGVIGMAVSQTSKGMAAPAGSNSSVGVVNQQLLIQQHPDLSQAQETMKAAYAEAKKDFDEKSANMNDQEKQAYYMQLQERLAQKEREVMGPIFDKINAAIKDVATAKGLSIVVDKQNVIYGGQDITDEVIKKFSK